MTVLVVPSQDIDSYNDWVIGNSAILFAEGGYTQIEIDGEIINCEVVGNDMNGEPLVSIGETVYEARTS